MILYWWNDALAIARELAAGTQIRHRVFKTPAGWCVEPLLEVAEPRLEVVA